MTLSDAPQRALQPLPSGYPTAKWAFTTRRMVREEVAALAGDLEHVRAGDLLLCRIERIGSHRNIQLCSGRPAELFVSDLVVLACGARYAPDQFEGIAAVQSERADLLAGGGVVGTLRLRHDRMKPPTRVQPLGRLVRADGRCLNLQDHALPPAPAADADADRRVRPPRTVVFGVVGSSMNAGKTAAAAALIHGLTRAGERVAAIKLTGTGAFGDINAYTDAGAHWAADFTDAGMASTYQEPPERIETGLRTLLHGAWRAQCTAAVIEIADGLLQPETAQLLTRDAVRTAIDAWLFAASCSMAALAGRDTLRRIELPPLALTGALTQSPLAMQEAQEATDLLVLPRERLARQDCALELLAQARRQRTPAP